MPRGGDGSRKPGIIARTLGMLAFAFSGAISARVFLTEQQVTVVDLILLLGAPIVLGVRARCQTASGNPEEGDRAR